MYITSKTLRIIIAFLLTFSLISFILKYPNIPTVSWITTSLFIVVALISITRNPILFWLEYNRTKKVVASMPNPLITFPMIIRLELDKDTIRKKWYKGESMKDQVLHLVDVIQDDMRKGILRERHKQERRRNWTKDEQLAFSHRYQQFRAYWNQENAFRATLRANGEDAPAWPPGSEHEYDYNALDHEMHKSNLHEKIKEHHERVDNENHTPPWKLRRYNHSTLN